MTRSAHAMRSLVEVDGPVRLVTLNRPDTLNATDAELHHAIPAVWAAARHRPGCPRHRRSPVPAPRVSARRQLRAAAGDGRRPRTCAAEIMDEAKTLVPASMMAIEMRDLSTSVCGSRGGPRSRLHQPGEQVVLRVLAPHLHQLGDHGEGLVVDLAVLVDDLAVLLPCVAVEPSSTCRLWSVSSLNSLACPSG